MADEKPMTEDEKRMTFIEHLTELRSRLIKSITALGVAVIACYFIANPIMDQLARPLAPLGERGLILAPPTPPANTEAGAPDTKPTPPAAAPSQKRTFTWTVMNPMETVWVQFKIAGYMGFVLALPFIIWQICSFVFPGLLPNERRLVQTLIWGCSGLAVLGVCVAYFGVFPMVLPYVLEWTPSWVVIQLRLNETMDLILKGMFGFAIAFQFPMVVLVLVYMGLLTPETMRKFRRPAIVGMAVLAAVLTPPDPFSMTVMLVPLLLLYESSVWLSYIVVRRKNKKEDTQELTNV